MSVDPLKAAEAEVAEWRKEWEEADTERLMLREHLRRARTIVAPACLFLEDIVAAAKALNSPKLRAIANAVTLYKRRGSTE